MKLEKERE
jgi:hypothetical protein